MATRGEAVATLVSSPLAAVAATGLHRFACLTAAATLFLIFAGGLVTSTGSGLAVPDWPLSFGQVMPKMTGGVFFEHGHRMIATGVGVLTIILALWTHWTEPRRSVRSLAWGSLVAVIAQGLLGGLTVILRLPPQVSVLHACLTQAFLCMVVTVAVVTGPGWVGRDGALAVPAHRIAVATTAAIYAQLIVGAIMRHTGAGLAIRDFPLSMGQLVPPLTEAAVRIHFLHRVMALVILVLVAATIARAIAGAEAVGGDRWIVLPALVVGVLVTLQVAAGAVTVLSGKHPYVTSFHVLGGAALLAASLTLAIRSSRAASVATGAAA